MGNENQNRSAENRHDFERTDSHRPLSVDSFILWAIEIAIGFHKGLQGMNGEKSQNHIFLFRKSGITTDTTYKKHRRVVGPGGTRKTKLTGNV